MPIRHVNTRGGLCFLPKITISSPIFFSHCYVKYFLDTVGGHKLDHLAINSTIGVAGKAGFTLASAATALVEFMSKCSNLCPPTVITQYAITKSKLKKMS